MLLSLSPSVGEIPGNSLEGGRQSLMPALFIILHVKSSFSLFHEAVYKHTGLHVHRAHGVEASTRHLLNRLPISLATAPDFFCVELSNSSVAVNQGGCVKKFIWDAEVYGSVPHRGRLPRQIRRRLTSTN